MEPTSTPAAPQEPPVEPPASPTPPTPPAPDPVPPTPPEPGISQTVPRNDGPPPPPPFTSSSSSSEPAAPVPPAAPAEPAVPVPGEPAAPMPNVMVGDGGMAPPAASGGAAAPLAPVISGGRRRPTKLMWAAIGVVILLIALAVWYFGYFMSSGVIYSQSLKNTGKGYDKLVDFTDKQQKLTEKGYVGTGSYKVKFSDFSTDGKINLKGDSDNNELTFDVGLGVTRVNADIRTIKSSGDTPDIYVKAQDIKGLGTVLGIPELDTSLAKLDNTWIVIDHTLIDNLDSIATAPAQANADKMQGPTRDQLLDEARAFGKVNQQYVFSTAKDKAITRVVQKYGIEKVDGHKTYHYKIALQPANVKKYIYAQRDALKASSLNDWLKKNKYDKDVYDSFNDAADSTKDIKTSDTYDIWMDVNNRVVYKIRFSEKKNPATNYVDVGLNYKGSDIFPFFVAGQFKDGGSNGTFSFITTLNTKTSDTNFNLNVNTKGSDGTGTVTANFDFKPSGTPVKITKPSGAKPLSQVLSELGFGDVLNQYLAASANTSSTAATKATDSKRASDMATIQTQLEAFFQNNGYYPSLKDMNSSSWLSANMKSLDQNALIDPGNPNKSKKLAAAPGPNVYSYQVTDENGNSCEADDQKCTQYTLVATLEGTINGENTIVKVNLD